MIELKTERLIIRSYKPSDAKAILEKFGKNTNIRKWLALDIEDYKLKDAKDFIAKNNPNEIALAITMKDNENEVIGGLGLHEINKTHKSAMLGYWVEEKMWGQGIIPEAATALLKYAFTELKLHRVWGKVFEENPASQKVMKKLGFKEEGKQRETFFKNNKWHSEFLFGILAKEFNPKE